MSDFADDNIDQSKNRLDAISMGMGKKEKNPLKIDFYQDSFEIIIS
jgi:hypothetical protein